MIGCAVVQNACIFGFAGLTRPDQWQAANALYVTGNIGQSSVLTDPSPSQAHVTSSKLATELLSRRLPCHGPRFTKDDRI